MITLIVMTDGRQSLLYRTLTALKMLHGPITRKLIHDDSGSQEFSQWLHDTFGDEYEIFSTGQRSGFGGAIISAWKQLQYDNNDWVFHLEDDFVMREPINLNDMMEVMDNNPHILQMALLRQAWSSAEIEAGGVMELDPDAYVQHSDGLHKWIEHRKFFTTNPSLYKKSLTIENPWPQGEYSEGRYGLELFSDGTKVCGYWGAAGSPPKVEHIGDYRQGTGY